MLVWHRFGLSGDQADLNTAIEVTESALRIATDDRDAALITAGLDEMLRARIERRGRPADYWR
jgi:hypothetical protein